MLFELGALSLTVALTGGCSSKSDPPVVNVIVATDGGTTELPPRPAGKGEACRTTADCVAPFVCVPSSSTSSLGGGVCGTGVFPVKPSAKQCLQVQCRLSSDCCGQDGTCQQYEYECQLNPTGPDGGPSTYCDWVSHYVCDDTAAACKMTCDPNQTDAGAGAFRCPFPTAVCSSAGFCVQCATSDHCPRGQVCTNGRCATDKGCVSDAECPGFSRCQSGACVPSGCKTDRECVAATKNVEATCKNGACIIPCATDLECGSPTNYRLISCVNGQCTNTGCDSDKDCELFQTGGADAGVAPRVSCR
jgi:Cys-rich repeat protein